MLILVHEGSILVDILSSHGMQPDPKLHALMDMLHPNNKK